MRPGTLPHHRTCGFPHSAVERSRPLYMVAARLEASYIAFCRGWRRSRTLGSSAPGACSDFIARTSVGRSGIVTAVVASRRFGEPSGPFFQPSLELCSFVLRSFVLPGFRRASSLLRPRLTSRRLSPSGSPRVSAVSFLSRRQALQGSIHDCWASRVLACSPAVPCLTACSCSYGREFAFGPFALVPCGSNLAVRLRLSSSPRRELSSR